MAQDILANRSSNLNLNSPHHLQLYQKVLFQGCQMASLLRYYDDQIGLTEAAGISVNEWNKIVSELVDLIT